MLSENGATIFDLGEWKSQVASRKNDDGTISFITIDPGTDGFEFVVGDREGKRVLIIRDGQHEYIFRENSEKQARMIQGLLDGDRLGKIPRLIDVAPPAHGDVIGQQLQRNDFQNRREFFGSRRDM